MCVYCNAGCYRVTKGFGACALYLNNLCVPKRPVNSWACISVVKVQILLSEPFSTFRLFEVASPLHNQKEAG